MTYRKYNNKEEKKKKTVSVFLALCMMFACLAAVAEKAAAPEEGVFVTYDGVLSIQAPNALWNRKA